MAEGEEGAAPRERERRRPAGPPAQVGAAAALLGIAALIDAVWGVVLLVASAHAPAVRHLVPLGVVALAVAAVTVAATLTLRRRPAAGRVLAAAVSVVAFASGLVDLPEGLLPMAFAVLVAWLLFGARASRTFFQTRVDA